MNWSSVNISKAELKKQQDTYSRMAMEMAKSAQRNGDDTPLRDISADGEVAELSAKPRPDENKPSREEAPPAEDISFAAAETEREAAAFTREEYEDSDAAETRGRETDGETAADGSYGDEDDISAEDNEAPQTYSAEEIFAKEFCGEDIPADDAAAAEDENENERKAPGCLCDFVKEHNREYDGKNGARVGGGAKNGGTPG